MSFPAFPWWVWALGAAVVYFWLAKRDAHQSVLETSVGEISFLKPGEPGYR